MLNVKLLSGGKGIITNRSPLTIKDVLKLSFENASNGMSVIFYRDNHDTLYRTITDNEVEVPRYFLKGSIKITVTSHRPKEMWLCEGFDCWTTNECIMITPVLTEFDTAITELRLENEKLRQKVAELESRQTQTEAKVEKMTEGYDVI